MQWWPRVVRALQQHWLLFVVMVVIVVAHIAWVILDTSPALWDIAGHSYRSAYFADLLSNGALRTILVFDTIYPPAQYLITAFFFVLFGYQIDIPQLSLVVWIIPYLLSVYRIGLWLFDGDAVAPRLQRIYAALAAWVSAAVPLVAHFSRIYDLDFAQLAGVTIAVAVLIQSRFFLQRRWTTVFAVVVSVTVLVKWTTILFLIAPIGYAIWYALQSTERSQLRDRVLSAFIALGIGVVLIAPWYIIHARDILISAGRTRNNIFSVPYENLQSIDNALYYIRQQARGMTPLLLAASLGGAIAVFAQPRRASRHRWMLMLLWIVVPYILMTFFLHSKESRYFLSAYPAFVLFSIGAIAYARRLYARWILGVLIIGWSVIAWVDTSWGMRVLPANVYDALDMQNVYGYQDIAPKDPKYGFTHPTQYHEQLGEVPIVILEDLEQHPEFIEDGVLDIAVVPNSIYLTAQQMQYASVLNGLDRVAQSYRVDYSLSTRIRDGEWREPLSAADYVIAKIGDQGPPIWGPNLKEIAATEDAFAGFEIVREWEVVGIEKEPRTVTLYRNSRR